jgi:hypothetical protein
MAWRTPLRQLLWLSLLAVPLMAHADLRDDMVALDQAYIPVLILSEESRPETAMAMDELLLRWDRFKQRQAYRSDRDKEWDFDIADIERQILNTQRLVEEGAFQDAHAALEPIREILMRMRQRVGLDYFTDALLRFHAPMAAMQRQLVALQATGSDHDHQTMAASYARARGLWEEVLDEPINPFEYGLDLKRGKRLRQQLLAERDLLTAFDQALAKDDLQAMADTAARIQWGFLACYRELGQFPQQPKSSPAN